MKRKKTEESHQTRESLEKNGKKEKNILGQERSRTGGRVGN